MAAVKVPADVELEDRLAFGLTAKQLGMLAGTAVAAYGSFLLLAPLLPGPLAIAAMAFVAAAGAALALVRHDGLAGEQLAVAITRYAFAPKRHVLAPEGIAPALPGTPRQPRVAPLDLPVQRVLRDGLIVLADGSHCRLLAARTTSFELRSQAEQAAFVAAFARFLNALTTPIQIDVRSEPVTLTGHADQIAHAADTHPEPLRQAALDHAGYLRALPRERVLYRRRIVLVLRTTDREPGLARTTLDRQAAQARELLAGAGVTAAPLEGDEAAHLLASALDPSGPLPDSHLEGVIHAQPLPQQPIAQADTQRESARPRRGRATRRSRPRRRTLAADVRDQRLSA